jgi:glycine/D-amino acid oxidase-like deaminating enzyme
MSTSGLIVIGNGVLGLSTALAVAEEQPGLQITLIGPSDRALAASPASGAMLGCFGEVTSTQLASPHGREKLALGVCAAGMWPEWIDSINDGGNEDDLATVNRGTFVVLNGKSTELDDSNYRAIETALASYNKTPEEIDTGEISGIDPLPDCRPIRAMYLPEEGSVDSGKLLARLNSRISTLKEIRVVNERVASIRIASGAVQGIQLRTGETISSPIVLLAAGFESQRFLDAIPELCRGIPRLFPGAGTSLLLRPTSGSLPLPCVLRTPNRSFACGLHAVPRSSGLVYIGATNHIRRDPFPGPTAYDVHFLIECATEQIQIALHRASVVSTTVGHRPVTIDGFPLVGRTSVSGLWLLTGTYRDGLHLSPLLAKHMAKEMLGKDGLIANHFVPERKPIVTLSRANAIKEAAKHQMAIAYEHSARMPGGWHGQVHELFEAMFSDIYNQIESDFVLPPDFLPMILYSNDRLECIDFFRRYYAAISA